MRYSEELIEQIKSSSDIVEVISQYVSLKRSGRSFFGLCPFHREKSPSFSVLPDKQIFYCFGCKVGGDVIHFVSKIENLDFKDTIEVLAGKAGIALPMGDNDKEEQAYMLKKRIYEINEKTASFYQNNLYNGENANLAREYVKKRKLNNEMLQQFLIGHSGNYNELYKHLKSEKFTENEIISSSLVIKNEDGKFVDRFRKRLMFPIKEVSGKTVAFGGRVLDDTLPKYVNSPENAVYSKGRHLYGLNVAKNSGSKEIIVVEGYMDAIALHQRGITNVVASLGTALTEWQGRLLRKYSEKVIISYDSDTAGQAATLRGLDILKNLGCDVRVIQMEGAKDPDEYVVKYGSGRFNLLVEQAISLVEFKVKVTKVKYDLNNTNDKIKFLNEIAKLLSAEENDIEKEIYIEKIANEYNISKEALYSQINKLSLPRNVSSKILDKTTAVKTKHNASSVDKTVTQRERMIISILLSNSLEVYKEVKKYVTAEDFKDDDTRQIIQRVYEEYEKGNINIINVLEEEERNYIAGVMAEDYEITNLNKTIKTITQIYKKEKLVTRQRDILTKLGQAGLTEEEKNSLGVELKEVIMKLNEK